MKDDAFGFEVVSNEALREEARTFVATMERLGFVAKPKTGVVRSAGLREHGVRYLFALSPAKHHLNFYLRKPARDASGELVRRTRERFADLARENPSGETILVVRKADDLRALATWLEEHLPWPPVSERARRRRKT